MSEFFEATGWLLALLLIAVVTVSVATIAGYWLGIRLATGGAGTCSASIARYLGRWQGPDARLVVQVQGDYVRFTAKRIVLHNIPVFMVAHESILLNDYLANPSRTTKRVLRELDQSMQGLPK